MLLKFITDWTSTHSAHANFALIKHIEQSDELFNELKISVNIKSCNVSQLLYHYVNKVESIPLCMNCSSELNFISFASGYPSFCSKRCKTIHHHTIGKFKEGHISGAKKFKENYGVGGSYHIELQTRKENTCIEKYGTKHPMQNSNVQEIHKESCIRNLGVSNPMKNNDIKNKVYSTNIDRYGYMHAIQNKDITYRMRENYVKSVKEKYGVDSVFQVPEIFDKIQQSAFGMKRIEHLKCQASYELDFIMHCKDINIFHKIEDGPFIWYEYNGKQKRYFSDFYIKDLNLIVEIKSNHWYQTYKEQNETKKAACIKLGYDFIFVIDKDYTNFDEIIKTLIH